MRSSRWRTDTSYSAKKRSDLRWRVERDLIAVWMTLPMAESKLKISNICYQRNPGRTWSSRMNSVDLKEFWTRSSLRLANSETSSEMEGRARLDRGMDDIADGRKQVEDLKYMLSEKSRQNMELQDELGRSKRVLDEKFFEAGKLRDESNAKGD